MHILGRRGNYRSVDYLDGKLFLIDQRLLPGKFVVRKYTDYESVVQAIRDMVVRGGPAIGIAGGFALALAARRTRGRTLGDFIRGLRKARDTLLSARPTAVDLANTTRRVLAAAQQAKDVGEAREAVEESARTACEQLVSACKRIGELGARLIPENARILTHCNAGALATVDCGTALAPIREAARRGRKPFVFVSETRPRLQGALTSWELLNERIGHVVLVDSASGFLMQKGEIDLCIVGADRICVRDGSVANKIGTYEKAVLAKENGIPFYVAAPTSTLDFSAVAGGIPIEERDASEVLSLHGKNLFPGARALNPSFDVTPARYITAIITEKGIFKAGELARPGALRRVQLSQK